MQNKLNNLKKLIKPVIEFVSKHRWQILAFVILAFILMTNTFHEKYPDEFDNIMGGKYILQGVFPNSGFFTHHAPFAYFLSAGLLLFSGISFVKFRVTLAIFYWLFHLGLFSYIKKTFSSKQATVSLLWSLLIALMATFDWSHMFLSDSLAGLFIVPTVMILFFFNFEKKKLRFLDVGIISILLASTILTSITYVFAVTIIYVLLFATIIQTDSFKYTFKNFLKFKLILAAPYLIFLLYLLLTNGFSDFYYQAIFFNKAYYVKSNGVEVSNPIRYAITIAVDYIRSYRAILVQVLDFNLSYPFAITMAVANTLIMFVLLFKKKYLLTFLLFGLTMFINVRSSIINIKETDYQSAPYHHLSLLFGILLIWLLINGIKNNKETFLKPIYYIFLVLFSSYLFYFTFFIFNSWMSKTYSKFMGEAPLIYDRPVIAPELNKILEDDDHYYIGPFAFEEHLYIKKGPKLASKYIITIPAIKKAVEVQEQMIADIDETKPKIIVFDIDFAIFSDPHPGDYFVSHLQNNYLTLGQITKESDQYSLIRDKLEEYDLNSDIFIHKDYVDEMLLKLESIGWVEKQ